MLLTKEVEVKVNSFTISHYKSLGYEIPMKKASKEYARHTKKEYVYDLSKTLTVKTRDLLKGSSEYVDVLCDYCNETISSIWYSTYIGTIEKFGGYACSKCRTIHQKKTCNEKYGCDNPTQNVEIRKKQMNSLIEHYGVDSPLKNEDIKQRVTATNIERFGHASASQNEELKKKQRETMYKNGTCPTSKQQKYINELYNGKLNYPFGSYNFDIFIEEDRMDIEIDFGGHNLSVKLGNITQEEFDQKELVRNNIIKRAGYKQMRVISSKDKLPADEILLQMLSKAKQYFSDYPEHSWIWFDIDTSTVRNAEQKDGVFFDYGNLRTIK